MTYQRLSDRLELDTRNRYPQTITQRSGNREFGRGCENAEFRGARLLIPLIALIRGSEAVKLAGVRLLILLILLIAGPAHGWSGEVIGVADGDTLTVLYDRTRVRVRLADIDAPETAQPFGTRSRQALAALCFQKLAAVEDRGRDRYGRTIGRVNCDGIDANAAQVSAGLAWVYDKYAEPDSPLYGLQDRARSARRGLWIDATPVAPWTWRRTVKAMR
jgi:endonuclease YncB( thermonuclease family)